MIAGQGTPPPKGQLPDLNRVREHLQDLNRVRELLQDLNRVKGLRHHPDLNRVKGLRHLPGLNRVKGLRLHPDLNRVKGLRHPGHQGNQQRKPGQLNADRQKRVKLTQDPKEARGQEILKKAIVRKEDKIYSTETS
jgi:hypothetical protein